VEATDFGPDGTNYVREQLKLAGDDGHPLAPRLLDHSLGRSFAFYESFEDPLYFEAGLHRDADLNRRSFDCLVAALTSWLSVPDEKDRSVVLEECLARWSDPFTQRHLKRDQPARLGEQLYGICGSGSSTEWVEHQFNLLSSYPGIGCLTRMDGTLDASRALGEPDLDAVAAGAVAVVVSAFDAEGYLLAPIADRLNPDELSCPERTK
jgi:hypothetical protein